MLPEMITTWTTIVLYALSAAAFIFGVTLGKGRMATIGLAVAGAGLAVHAVAIGLRWARVGHPPLLGFFEVASGLAFLMVAAFLALSWRYRGIRIAGAAVMPVAFFIMGATLLVDPTAEQIGGSLASAWLAIHVLFANLAFGSYAAAFTLAVTYLLRDSGRDHRWRSLLDKLPAQQELDGLTFRIVGAGFVFQGVMIAAGAVWANEAWGSYWNWDPIETWSLIAWAVYALYLHLTLTMGWRGRRAAWVLVIALPVIAFSLLGVPVVYDSIHGAYLKT